MFYWLMKKIFRIFLQVYHRIEVIGLENIPSNGRLLIVGNHISYLDPFYIGAILPRKIHFMAKAEAFRNPVTRWFLYQFGAFPVDRSKADVQAIKSALRHLQSEEVVGLFPEGGIREQDSLSQIKHGAAYLSLRTNTPVIPVYIQGTLEAFREGDYWIRPAKIKIQFGRAIFPNRQAERKKEIKEKVSQEILGELRSLRNKLENKLTG